MLRVVRTEFKLGPYGYSLLVSAGTGRGKRVVSKFLSGAPLLLKPHTYLPISVLTRMGPHLAHLSRNISTQNRELPSSLAPFRQRRRTCFFEGPRAKPAATPATSGFQRRILPLQAKPVPMCWGTSMVSWLHPTAEVRQFAGTTNWLGLHCTSSQFHSTRRRCLAKGGAGQVHSYSTSVLAPLMDNNAVPVLGPGHRARQPGPPYVPSIVGIRLRLLVVLELGGDPPRSVAGQGRFVCPRPRREGANCRSGACCKDLGCNN